MDKKRPYGTILLYIKLRISIIYGINPNHFVHVLIYIKAKMMNFNAWPILFFYCDTNVLHTNVHQSFLLIQIFVDTFVTGN